MLSLHLTEARERWTTSKRGERERERGCRCFEKENDIYDAVMSHRGASI
jgi:hypothetical protein